VNSQVCAAPTFYRITFSREEKAGGNQFKVLQGEENAEDIEGTQGRKNRWLTECRPA
jgi:hypothetical protein